MGFWGVNSTVALPSVEATEPVDYPGLHNVVTYAPGLYSGSVPHGEQGLRTLAQGSGLCRGGCPGAGPCSARR